MNALISQQVRGQILLISYTAYCVLHVWWSWVFNLGRGFKLTAIYKLGLPRTDAPATVSFPLPVSRSMQPERFDMQGTINPEVFTLLGLFLQQSVCHWNCYSTVHVSSAV